MTKKYALITDKEIDEGLSSGDYKKDKIGLIRNKDGQIVKHLKEGEEKKEYSIPSTIIQINQNVIYQADLGPVIESILKIDNTRFFGELEETYQIVLDKLKYYKDHKQRLDELNSKSLEALSLFEIRLERSLKEINTQHPSKDNTDRVFESLDRYFNVIFIYIISAYWLHGSKFSNDHIASEKIKNIEIKIRPIYEALLIKGDITSDSLANSVYAHLFINGMEKIHLIDKFVKYDSRCNTSLDFFESFSKLCKLENYDYAQACSFIKAEYSDFIEYRIELSEKLYHAMDKIEYLKNINGELLSVGSIKIEEIDESNIQDDRKNILTAIPFFINKDELT
ncbi:hypothetical protein [Pectobacterium carotovorum]|uniref:hypothetical protein n=1 Tax=Pectobacterium carotovorum TaxID=554 RepID=UPI0010FDFEF3|nr:hypothetical protein [Pectobacterium carotovorum]KAA3667206.1 hypothetical protein FEV48_11865 [Pectobacterium carotovorum subsp. carotovorum]